MKRFKEALALADECLAAHIEMQTERPYYEPQVRFVRCLALRGLDEFEGARAEFERGDAVYSKHAPKVTEQGSNWIDWMFCSRLRSEVESKKK